MGNESDRGASPLVCRRDVERAERDRLSTGSRALLPVAAALFAAGLSAQLTHVIPDGMASAAGGSANTYPWGTPASGLPGLRVLSCYDSSNFTTANITNPILITRLRWRANDSSATWSGGVYTFATVSLSTAAVDVSGVTTTWAANHGPDLTMCYAGPVTVQPGAGSGAGVPGPFHVDVLFTTPFLYDPQQGDLCIDTEYQGGAFVGGSLVSLDVDNSGSGKASRVYGSTMYPNANGTTQNHGLVVQLTYTPMAANTGNVVINEFSYDDTGIDDREFVELYNADAVPVDLSGWQLVSYDIGGLNAAYAIPGGTVLAPGGYYVMGANVPNVNLVLGATNLFENDTESLTLLDGSSAVVDSVVYEAASGPAPPGHGEGEPIYPEHVAVDTHETSWSRLRDGQDSDDNARDFRVARASPGTTNDAPTTLSYKEAGDGTAPGTTVPGWYGGSSEPVFTDPIAAGIPSSPQGGNVLEFPLGPGDDGTAWMEADPQVGSYFRAEVYLDASPLPIGQQRAWSIGVRGGTGTPFVVPDPTWSSPVGSNKNGNRGVAWTFVVDGGNGTFPPSATLYLLDHGDGGEDHVRLLTLPVTGSGWQTLELHVTGQRCVATVAGVCYHRLVHWTEGDLYVAHGASTPTARRPLYLDDVCLQLRDDVVNPVGLGCQGSCLEQNFFAHTLDSGPTRERGAGTYAIEVPGTTARVTYACVLSGTRTGLSTTSTMTIRAVDPMGKPGAILRGPMPLLAVGAPTPNRNEGPAWWAADLRTAGNGAWPLPTSTFFLEFAIDQNLYLPIASEEGGANAYSPEQSTIWFNGTSGWTQMSQGRGWAWAFVCEDDTGDAQADTTSELTPGSTAVLVLRGGSATTTTSTGFGIGILSTLPGAVSMAPFGAPGCTLYADPFAALVVTAFVPTNGLGEAQWLLPIPNTPSVTGLQLYSQWLASDPGLNPAGFTTTSAIRIEIQ
ncbi:MAG: lamin tail domain-containing protein [Planctomycetes bacterium]|nr:lamin tail domain-containing protein [Planctomycetota bacterium]